MATPTTPRTSTGSANLDVLNSPIAASIMAAEFADHADRIEADAREAGTTRISAARILNVRRFSAQLDRLHGGDE